MSENNALISFGYFCTVLYFCISGYWTLFETHFGNAQIAIDSYLISISLSFFSVTSQKS